MRIHRMGLGLAALLACALAARAAAGEEPRYKDRPLSAWLEDLHSRDARVRRAAADVLGKLGPIAAAAVPALQAALEDDDQDVRINASEAILAIVGPTLP